MKSVYNEAAHKEIFEALGHHGGLRLQKVLDSRVGPN